ncbi:MAG: aminotransferase class IV [bacterium]|nr:aminotransferase IV [Gammaproteobacteria bacterium]HIL96143.1 aminotransferase IV [Pseudomonadales bacterium]
MTSPDPRNRHVRHYVAGRLVTQYEAAIPLFDSGLLHGKLVWSAPRLVQGRLFRFQDHLNKIRHSAELNHFPLYPSDEEIVRAIRETLAANDMFDGVHIRISVTAGDQITASMDVDAVINWDGTPSEPKIIVMPEYRDAVYAQDGISLITSSFLRPGPHMVDQRSHDNNQNASSRALYEAKQAGATSALMYDDQGYVAEAAASHMAIIKRGKLYTPFVRCSPSGVTRKVILELCERHGIPAEESDITSSEVTSADEVLLLGTMSGPVSVVTLDGRPVGNGKLGNVTRQLYALYAQALQDPAQGYQIAYRGSAYTPTP